MLKTIENGLSLLQQGGKISVACKDGSNILLDEFSSLSKTILVCSVLSGLQVSYTQPIKAQEVSEPEDEQSTEKAVKKPSKKAVK